MSAIFQSFYQTIDDTAEPEVLGLSSVQFNSAVFIGQKAKDTPNTSSVFVCYHNASFVVRPGVGESWNAPAESYADASQFEIRATVSGDGVLCVYTLADFKSFSDLEMSVEEAVRRYLLTIGATLDDCSFTTGITDDERTADNVNVYVSSATERIINSGVYDCDTTVQVRSQVAKSGDTNQLLRHRLRTAYVRDLITDPDAEQIISSLGHRLHVYDHSIREVTCEHNVEGRMWLAEMRFTLTASNSGIR